MGGVAYTLDVPLGESHDVVYRVVVAVGVLLVTAWVVGGIAWFSSFSSSLVEWGSWLGLLPAPSGSPLGESRKITDGGLSWSSTIMLSPMFWSMWIVSISVAVSSVVSIWTCTVVLVVLLEGADIIEIGHYSCRSVSDDIS